MRRLLTLAAGLFARPAVASRSPRPTRAEEEFDPPHEWELKTWVDLPLGLDINKAVAYLILGTIVTCVARHRPDARQVREGAGPGGRRVGEMVYEIAQVQVAEQGLPTKAIGRWFPYVASLMLFIWVINMLGFIPLPLSDEKVDIGGVELPTLAIFAATSTLSVTLALALMTFVFTHVEGIRANGAVKYFKSWIPEVPKAMLPLIVPARDPRPVHAADQALRPALREHARRPHADPHVHRPDLPHPLGRVPVLGPDGERLLPLRGRDRRLDPGLYLRRPVRHLHRLGDRARALKEESHQCCRHFFLAAAEDGADAGKAIALALGIGLGSLGAGIGIGNIFGSMIQAVARQPELRGELTGIQWLGFALTEAVVFYGLIGGLLAFVLI